MHFIMKIDYKFKDEQLLKRALTHPSCSNRKNIDHYEKLEFLGDSILGFVIAEIVYNTFPNASEGELSLMHSRLIGTEILSQIALNLSIDKAMVIDIGEEKSGGRTNKNNLENILEAVIAAIYLDSDITQVKKFIMSNWHSYLSNQEYLLEKNPKSILQEWAQQKGLPIPQYQIIDKVGSAHSPLFTISLNLEGFTLITAEGASKKEATLIAAKKMLTFIKENNYE